MTTAAAFQVIRLVHRYSGLFFALTILFFAITGGLQMFGLHETSRGSSYVPSAILVQGKLTATVIESSAQSTNSPPINRRTVVQRP
jgi:hypothetical protein